MTGIRTVCLPRGYLGHSSSANKWFIPKEGRLQYLRGVAERQVYEKSIAIWEHPFCGSDPARVLVTYKGPTNRGIIGQGRKYVVRPLYQDEHASLELRPLRITASVTPQHRVMIDGDVAEYMVCVPKREYRVMDNRVLLLKGPVKKRRRGHESFAAPGNYWTALEDDDLFSRDERDARRYRQLGAMKRPA